MRDIDANRLRADVGGGSSPCSSEAGERLPSIAVADVLLNERLRTGLRNGLACLAGAVRSSQHADRDRYASSKMSGCAATTFAISLSFTLSFCEETRSMSNALAAEMFRRPMRMPFAWPMTSRLSIA